MLVAMGKHRQQIALVVDRNDRLLGTVTDGDVRRSIINEISADQPIEGIMNATPATSYPTTPRSEQLEIMATLDIHHLPLVNDEGQVVGLAQRERLLETKESRKPNHAVLLAGGRGERLRPLTNDVPKPLLHLGGRPILETIIRQLRDHGIENFYISLNHMGEQIRAHFGGGDRFGVAIEYLEESRPLGTAGPLSLIPTPPEAPVLVMNGDILTSIDFSSLLSFHDQKSADITIASREIDVEVPYGVIQFTNEEVSAIIEKPTKKYVVSAGIYVVEPRLLAGMTPDTRMDMPELIQNCIDQKMNVAGFPIYEYWIDIGQIEEFKRASGDYSRIVSD